MQLVFSAKKKWNEMNNNYANFSMIVSLTVTIILLLVVLTFLSDKFLTTSNLINIINQCTVYIILGIGMTLVFTTGGLDISVGSVVGLAASISGYAILEAGYPIWVGLIIAMLIGVACGSFNGFFISILRVNPIIVTLGTMTMFKGLAYVFTNGLLFYGYPPAYRFISTGTILQIPVPIWIAFVVFLAGYYLLHKTKFGRHITALGGNKEAASLAGIHVKRNLFVVYAMMGLLAGLAGIVASARIDAAVATLGTGYELHVIASVVLGGSSIYGGRGIMVGTLLGTILIQILSNGILLAGVSAFYQNVFIGLLVVVIVAIRTQTIKGE